MITKKVKDDLIARTPKFILDDLKDYKKDGIYKLLEIALRCSDYDRMTIFFLFQVTDMSIKMEEDEVSHERFFYIKGRGFDRIDITDKVIGERIYILYLQATTYGLEQYDKYQKELEKKGNNNG